MSTEDIISARRDAAIQKWTEAVFAMYPFETTGFIRTQRDQFANPVGHATRAAGDVQGFLDMGDRLDTLCLMAFNLYLADREQVYAERVAQQRREASQIRRWAARHGLVENQDGE